MLKTSARRSRLRPMHNARPSRRPMVNVHPDIVPRESAELDEPKGDVTSMEIAHFLREEKVPVATARRVNADPSARKSRRRTSA